MKNIAWKLRLRMDKIHKKIFPANYIYTFSFYHRVESQYFRKIHDYIRRGKQYESVKFSTKQNLISGYRPTAQGSKGFK